MRLPDASNCFASGRAQKVFAANSLVHNREGSENMTSSIDTPPEQLTAAALFDVKGLKVVVTGAGTGMFVPSLALLPHLHADRRSLCRGLMIARTLACNGATVYITGRREDVLKVSAAEHGKTVGGKIVPLQQDVTDKDSIEKVKKEVEAKEGYIDLLVRVPSSI